jgi:putative ABC transport system substrate-binding protein
MRRRDFMIGIAGSAVVSPLGASAQQPAKLATVGYLGANTPSAEGRRLAAFLQRLRELGWVEGRTIAIEVRWAEGRNERYAEIAAEFVRLKVDVIVTAGSAAIVAAKQATSTTGRQRHRPFDPGDRSDRQAARAFARGRARFPAVGDPGP